MHAKLKKDHMTIEKNAITEETVDLMELEVEITTFARMMIAKVGGQNRDDRPPRGGAGGRGVVVDAVVVEEERENSKGNLEMIELASSLSISETAVDLITGEPMKMTSRQNKTRQIPPQTKTDNQ